MDLEFFHVFFMVGAAITAIWWLWVCLSKTQPLISTGTWRAILLGSVVVNLAILFYVLTTWASWDVRGDPYYLIGYASLGFLWVYGTVPWLGTFVMVGGSGSGVTGLGGIGRGGVRGATKRATGSQPNPLERSSEPSAATATLPFC